MRLEKASAEGTKVSTSNLHSSLVATTTLVPVAVVGALLIPALNLAVIEYAYVLQSVNSLINLGADSIAY
jgi:hypothetical protein